MERSQGFELQVGGRQVRVGLEAGVVEFLDEGGNPMSSLPLQVAAGSFAGDFSEVLDDKADARVFGDF